MLSKPVLGWGAILVGILIALTEYLAWSGNVNYLWAVLVLVLGIATLKQASKMPNDNLIAIIILALALAGIRFVFFVNINDSSSYISDPFVGDGLGTLCSGESKCRDFLVQLRDPKFHHIYNKLPVKIKFMDYKK